MPISYAQVKFQAKAKLRVVPLDTRLMGLEQDFNQSEVGRITYLLLSYHDICDSIVIHRLIC